LAASIQIKNVNWWHERLIEYMIANPQMTLGQIAKHFNVSQSWLSIVKNSDVFIDLWRIRSKDHAQAVTADIKTKAYALAELALDGALENVQQKVEFGTLTLSESLEVLDVTMKRFGYGEQKPGSAAPQVNINLGLISPQQLAEARKKMRGEAVPLEAMPLELEASKEDSSES